MTYQLRFLQYNERSVLIEWPAIIDECILQDVLSFKNKIENIFHKVIVEVVSSYSSLLVIYKNTIDNVNGLFLSLKQVYSNENFIKHSDSKLFKIPVCYDHEFATDLNDFSEAVNVSGTEIVKRHSEVVYTVFFIGFLPGFLYLGGLDSTLYLDRKITPNLNVKKGAVGIGGKQTGIYPQNSPGGWHIIGNSPIELFNSKQNPPCFIKAGDKVKFEAISKSKYLKIQNAIAVSSFDSNTLLIHG